MNSSCTPDSSRTSVYIDKYVHAVNDDIFKELQKTNNRKSLLSAKEQRILYQLQCRRYIIIRRDDNEGGVVVMNRIDYVTEAFRQLHDANFYKVVTHDPTLSFSTLINATLLDLRDKK